MTIPPQELVERALSLSTADETAVIVEDQSEANLRWASNSLTTNGVTRSRTVTVIAVRGRASGVVSRQDPDLDDLAAMVADAESVAGRSEPAEDAAPLFGGEVSTGDWEAPAASTGISVFGRFAPDLGETLEQAGSEQRLLFGFAYHRMVSCWMGTSAGARCRYDQPTGHTEFNAKSPDYTRSSWAGVATDAFTDVDPHAIDADLARRLAWADRRVDLPAGRYDTVLPPSAVADLMIDVYWSADGRDAHEGRTVFSGPSGGTRVGERITSQPLSLTSDPSQPGMACAPFLAASRSGGGRSVFDNGAPLERTDWIDGGVVRALVQSRHSAALTGLDFTPYIDNLALRAAQPAGSTEDLVAGMERGLLLTCLWYIREVDPRLLLLTGLTRDGVYLVEHGEVTAAVNNFRFNESPVDVLARTSAVGASVRTLPREWCDYFTRTEMPPLRIPDFNMSSVSEAS